MLLVRLVWQDIHLHASLAMKMESSGANEKERSERKKRKVCPPNAAANRCASHPLELSHQAANISRAIEEEEAEAALDAQSAESDDDSAGEEGDDSRARTRGPRGRKGALQAKAKAAAERSAAPYDPDDPAAR